MFMRDADHRELPRHLDLQPGGGVKHRLGLGLPVAGQRRRPIGPLQDLKGRSE
jgi:hypothetical protein